MIAISAERELALDAVLRLREAGYQALWAGGCVRDLLLGYDPTDYDVATSATPDQVRQVFGRRRTLPVGASFGVIIVLGTPPQAGQIDVATFRTDAAYSDGRRPDAVTFSTPEEDALRRDFTINGMFYDPLAEQVIDYVAGQADLQRKLVRAIGRAADRIAEDKLRMLRAIRIAARFGFAIEPHTRQAIADQASQVEVVSGERIWSEVRKTLDSGRPAWGLAEWAELGLLQPILPEVAEHWPARHVDMTSILHAAADRPWLVRWCGLLWAAVGSTPLAVSEAMSSLKSRLKLANEICAAVKYALTAQPALEQAEHKLWSAVQPWLVDPSAGLAVDLLELRARIAPPRTAPTLAATAGWLRERMCSQVHPLDPPPLLIGRDLIELGLKPGPRFKQLLSHARQLQLDRLLADRPAALQWLNGQIDSDKS